MSIKSKDSGRRWEHEVVEILNEFDDCSTIWKRIPMSGAMGSLLELPSLKGDVRGKYPCFPREFVGEAKYGYGGKSMTIHKEWFDKISKEAKESFALPLVFLKFKGARSGVRHVVAMDFETWNELMLEFEKLYESVFSG